MYIKMTYNVSFPISNIVDELLGHMNGFAIHISHWMRKYTQNDKKYIKLSTLELYIANLAHTEYADSQDHRIV